MLPPLAMKLEASSSAASTSFSSLKVEYSEAETPAEVATSPQPISTSCPRWSARALAAGRMTRDVTSRVRRMMNSSETPGRRASSEGKGGFEFPAAGAVHRAWSWRSGRAESAGPKTPKG
ncbi:hypothetical protein D3C86_1672970 [compost metagenome]